MTITTPGAAGSAAYNPAFSLIATLAYRDLGIIDETETPSPAQMQDAFNVAQLLLKQMEGLGIHVWTQEEAILFLQAGQNRYLLGDPGGTFTPDRAVDAFAYYQTTLAAGAGGGSTSIQVSSTAGLASGQQIGVGLDSGTTFWTTISGAPTGSSVPLAAVLPSSASGGSNNVFAYSQANAITRPLKVPFMRRITYAPAGSIQGPNEIPIDPIMARKDYMALPNKLTPGPPTRAGYYPKEGFGELFCWPTPAAATDGIRFTWLRPIADLLNQASNVDIPQEWLNCLRWNIARELGLSFSVPPQKWSIINSMAMQALDMAQSWDRDSEDVQFGYDYYGQR